MYSQSARQLGVGIDRCGRADQAHVAPDFGIIVLVSICVQSTCVLQRYDGVPSVAKAVAMLRAPNGQMASVEEANRP